LALLDFQPIRPAQPTLQLISGTEYMARGESERDSSQVTLGMAAGPKTEEGVVGR